MAGVQPTLFDESYARQIRPLPRGRRFTPEFEQVIAADRLAGASVTELVEKYGGSQGSIRQAIKRVKKGRLQLDPKPRKYEFNERYFQTIDTPAKAAWLGFIMADGNVHVNKQNTGHCLQIGLAKRDRGHLVKLCEALGRGTDAVKDYQRKNVAHGYKGQQPFSKVAFHSRELFLDLAAHGVHPNKSFTCAPWNGPPELMPSFYRGLWEGDGSLTSFANGRNRGWTWMTCGSRPMMEGLSSFLKVAIGIGFRAIGRDFRVNPHHSIFNVQCCGVGKVQAVLRLLYADATPADWLDRKKARADECLLQVIKAGKKPPASCRLCGRTAKRWEAWGPLCDMHYRRCKKYGDPLLSRPTGGHSGPVALISDPSYGVRKF